MRSEKDMESTRFKKKQKQKQKQKPIATVF